MSNVLDKFLRYVAVDTQSNEESESQPSEEKELVLLRMLRDELQAMGVEATLDEYGYVMATIPSNVFAARRPISTCPGSMLESGGEACSQRNSSLSTPRTATESGTLKRALSHAARTCTARQSQAAMIAVDFGRAAIQSASASVSSCEPGVAVGGKTATIEPGADAAMREQNASQRALAQSSPMPAMTNP